MPEADDAEEQVSGARVARDVAQLHVSTQCRGGGRPDRGPAKLTSVSRGGQTDLSDLVGLGKRHIRAKNVIFFGGVLPVHRNP